MSAQTILVPSFPTPTAPRGARIAADLFTRAWRAFAARPVVKGSAAPVSMARRIAEASRVRALAWQVRDADPRFAAELQAAADRHERLGE